MDKISLLLFDIKGEFAHFRKYYTTTSPLTFSIPPRTVIIGLMSAVLGLKKNEYAGYFKPEDCKIALEILNPGKKFILKENWRAGIDFKGLNEISQIPLELIKNPRYRIYFYHKDNKLLTKLTEYIKGKISIYTPYLGISEFICQLKYVDYYNNLNIIETDGNVETNCVIAKDIIKEIKVSTNGKQYIESIIPFHLDLERKFSYLDVIFENNGDSIIFKQKRTVEYVHVNNKKIIFMEKV